MENNQKNAAEVQTSVPDLIPANYREKAETLGWLIDEDKVCGVFTFRQGSPAGEDYSFDLYADDDFGDGVAAAVRRVYEDFDVDEHVALFAEASVRARQAFRSCQCLSRTPRKSMRCFSRSPKRLKTSNLMHQSESRRCIPAAAPTVAAYPSPVIRSSTLMCWLTSKREISSEISTTKSNLTSTSRLTPTVHITA